MITAKKFNLIKRFEGLPKLTDFQLVEEKLAPVNDGEVLVQAEWFSVDPYMRVYMSAYPLNSQLIGYQVAKILESKSPGFPVGKYLFAHLGWRTHTVFNPVTQTDGRAVYLLPELGSLPRSIALGTLGSTGNTAYFGLLEILRPKAGETLVVSGAAGAVGSVVGQIGKIKGLRVIGIAGSDEKCKWLTQELGFDHAINYKTADIAQELKTSAPDGVDCYFDNVGGKISDIVMSQMNEFGRIAICGAISSYNTTDASETMVSHSSRLFIGKQLRMEGFIVRRWVPRWMEGVKQLKEWVEQGKVKYGETVTEGFENIPKAFIDMLQGGNTGKAVVRA